MWSLHVYPAWLLSGFSRLIRNNASVCDGKCWYLTHIKFCTSCIIMFITELFTSVICGAHLIPTLTALRDTAEGQTGNRLKVVSQGDSHSKMSLWELKGLSSFSGDGWQIHLGSHILYLDYWHVLRIVRIAGLRSLLSHSLTGCLCGVMCVTPFLNAH